MNFQVLPYFLKSEGGTAKKQSPEGGNAAHLPEDRSPQQGGNTAHLPLDVVRYATNSIIFCGPLEVKNVKNLEKSEQIR